MLNQRVSVPFGDVNFVSTPKTDRFVAAHQQQERQDELSKEQQLNDLDKQLSAHLGNMLNPDIPEFVQKVQDYKTSKKQLLFDKNLQKDPIAYAKKQVEVNQKLGDAMQIVADSSKRKQFLASQLPDYYKSPHKYVDDFSNRYVQSLNTPTSQVRNNPDQDNFLWSGPGEDHAKLLVTAAGKLAPRSVRKEVIGGGVSTIETPVSGFNDPLTYKGILDNYRTDHKYQMNANKILANITPEEKSNIEQKYAAIPLSKWKDWGYDKPPDLEPSDPTDPAEVYNSLQAKIHAVQSQHTVGLSKTIDNKAELEKMKMADKMKLLYARFGVSKEMERIRQANRLIVKDAGGKEDSDLSAWVNVGPDVLQQGTPENVANYFNSAAVTTKPGFKVLSVDSDAPASGQLIPYSPSNKRVVNVTYQIPRYNETTKGFDVVTEVKQFDPSSKTLKTDLANLGLDWKGSKGNIKLKNTVFDKESYSGEKPKQSPKPKKAKADANNPLGLDLNLK